jgi:hypothetical protein
MGPIKKVMVDDPFEQIVHVSRPEKLPVANGKSKHAPN